MANSTLNQPVQFQYTTLAGLGLSFILAMEAMETQFAELSNPTGDVTLVEIGAGGSRTVRRSNVQHLGGILPTALSNETDAPPFASRDVGYADVSTASYGTAHAQSYTSQIYDMPNVRSALDPMELIQAAPFAAYTLMRYLGAQALAAISSRVGAAGTRLSIDDMIAAAAAFNSQRPTIRRPGRPKMWLHDYQDNQLRESARVEPGFVQNGVGMSTQGVREGEEAPNFLGLGFDVRITDRVPTAGGARTGGAFDPGGLLIGIGQTQNISPPMNGAGHIANGMLGLLIQEVPSSRAQRTTRWDLLFEMGAAMADIRVYRQIGVDSINAA